LHTFEYEKGSSFLMSPSLVQFISQFYSNDSAEVLDVEGHPYQAHPPCGGEEAILYVLLRYKTGGWQGRTFVTIVHYRLTSADPQEIVIVRGSPEEDGPASHACPLSILGRLSPTDDRKTQEWRAACWRYWQGQAQPVEAGTSASLPVALLSTPVNCVVCFHRSQLFQLSWTGDKGPRYGRTESLTLHLQPIYRLRGVQGIETFRAEGLQGIAGILYRHEVPLEHGWVPLAAISVPA
jgi:hypothetical protein